MLEARLDGKTVKDHIFTHHRSGYNLCKIGCGLLPSSHPLYDAFELAGGLPQTSYPLGLSARCVNQGLQIGA